MAPQPSSALEQLARLQVEMETPEHGRRVKIRVEHYDERLGWYTAGSLSIPLCQLPLLEQAVEAMRARPGPEERSPGKIIPFPGLKTF